jgi:probable rRNA maturation factor
VTAAPVIPALEAQIDIRVDEPGWGAEDPLERLARRALEAAVAVADLDCPAAPELSLLFTNDAAMRALNAEWRGKDKPTNVLSFPAHDGENADDPLLGDIALALETCRAEAAADDKPFDHHVTHLLVHGILHLFGFDHRTDADAEEMEGFETQILAALGIPDPYAGTVPAAHAD